MNFAFNNLHICLFAYLHISCFCIFLTLSSNFSEVIVSLFMPSTFSGKQNGVSGCQRRQHVFDAMADVHRFSRLSEHDYRTSFRINGGFRWVILGKGSVRDNFGQTNTVHLLRGNFKQASKLAGNQLGVDFFGESR